jgi:hypothetical protein
MLPIHTCKIFMPSPSHKIVTNRKFFFAKKMVISILIFFSKIGISLIEVPYWWDRTPESLAATIYAQRPDLFTKAPIGKPIPSTPPPTHAPQTKIGNTPEIPQK